MMEVGSKTKSGQREVNQIGAGYQRADIFAFACCHSPEPRQLVHRNQIKHEIQCKTSLSKASVVTQSCQIILLSVARWDAKSVPERKSISAAAVESCNSSPSPKAYILLFCLELICSMASEIVRFPSLLSSTAT